MITIIIRYKMNSGKGKQFNEWQDEMQKILVQFPGLLNKEVFLAENKTGQGSNQ